MNNIFEGIILVNSHKVVTHINQPANELLKLIPGEIIDQSLSRKVSHPKVMKP